jgi:transcriptional antiterminator RfaH
LILTKPAGERIATCNLERQGYRVYYPRLLRPVVYRGKWIDRIGALFPRYLFLQVDSARQSMAPVRSTLGVAEVVRFGGECAVVPDAIVEGLMHRADPQSGLHRLSQSPLFERGAAVSIVAGAFEGLEGIFERDGGDDRVVVLLKLLGRETPVRVPAHFVLPSVA